MGASLVIYPANQWYAKVTPDDVEEIFEKSILNDEVFEQLAATDDT